jgi:ABC-type multidrug transport system ATPase subunit
MQIELREISRVFGKQPIFKQLNYTFKQGETYAVLGGNGSGKSTLLTLLYSALSPSSGEILWSHAGSPVAVHNVPFRTSLSGPYFELIEELTAEEFLNFHQKFKPFLPGINADKVLEIAELQAAKHKEIRHFSSGMKQRFKLAISLLAAVDLILLDEPTSNLDPKASIWYQQLVQEYRNNRTLIVGSNFNEAEMGFCMHQVNISDYKDA